MQRAEERRAAALAVMKTEEAVLSPNSRIAGGRETDNSIATSYTGKCNYQTQSGDKQECRHRASRPAHRLRRNILQRLEDKHATLHRLMHDDGPRRRLQCVDERDEPRRQRRRGAGRQRRGRDCP